MSYPTGNAETTRQLKVLLASSYTLYLKTHNFHWNVTGPMFASLHMMFETHYTELATAVDDIAERIRALGDKAPGSYSEFAELSRVKESVGEVKAEAMLRELADDQTIIADIATQLIATATEDGDDATAGLATDRVVLHEKNRWMLHSHLE